LKLIETDIFQVVPVTDLSGLAFVLPAEFAKKHLFGLPTGNTYIVNLFFDSSQSVVT